MIYYLSVILVSVDLDLDWTAPDLTLLTLIYLFVRYPGTKTVPAQKVFGTQEPGTVVGLLGNPEFIGNQLLVKSLISEKD